MTEFLPTTITHLECSKCGERYSHEKLQNLCRCGGPLLARYELTKAARTLTREALKAHFTSAQIVDLDLLVGVVNLTNRLTDPLGADLEFPEEKI